MKTQQELKEDVAQAAIEELRRLPPAVVIGVGTGSTVDCLIEAIASNRLELAGYVASSIRTEKKLQGLGLPVASLDQLTEPMALYIDGADEIEPGLCMVKGGGAALTREKVVASAAHRFVCIVDESKLVSQLGAFPLPIEVITTALRPVSWALEALGGRPTLREGVVTDSGQSILDVHGLKIDDPLAWEDRLNTIPGIVCNGIFARQRAQLALVAGQDGVRRLAVQ
ncbi:MAG: ribose-5-phosphate isomerase RpiA [Betaproteobacteria bacterium]|nr:ribose-5-phosphate isomerase RpiA [Betaproteobacteria bacterium]NBY13681.1 ribose-5-phosphate isomerase RpiA [Betaproteobacteria bacterium]NDF03630.1 ribose-5-phosphate isomerase RpiA [Betaproteobacteria bacterium]